MMMTESIFSIQQDAFEQIGLFKPLCSGGTPLMDIKESVPRGCGRERSSLCLLASYALLSANRSKPPCAASFSIRTIITLYFSDCFWCHKEKGGKSKRIENSLSVDPSGHSLDR